MPDEEAGSHALLVELCEVGLHHRAALAFLDESGELLVRPGCMRGERMLGGHGTEGGAHQGVGARGEDAEHFPFARKLVRETDVDAMALADPVGLHRLDALRPSGELSQIAEQLLCVGRDPHVVHRDLALLDERSGAPAAAVDHLLVGENRPVDRVPVHRAGLLVGEALFEHAQKQPLVPAIVLGRAGRKLALPVDRETQRLELLLHGGDVLVGPFRGRHAVRHRGVFCGQTEGVPTHRLKHVEAPHPMKAGHHVADGVVAHVSHMQLARRVGEHRQAVELRAAAFSGRLLDRAKREGSVPVLLRFALDDLGVVLGLHERVREKDGL